MNLLTITTITTVLLSSVRNIRALNSLQYVPKTSNQKEYQKSLYAPNIDLVLCTGPAGTGKTLFACQYAIKSLIDKKIDKKIDKNIDRIIITRPTVTIEEDLGYLPGNINSKMFPFTINIYDIFGEYCTKNEIDTHIKNRFIEIAPLGFLQGRTFKNSIIIADEMQNSSKNQMFMLLTRIGTNSKMIITGDPDQTVEKDNGLVDIIDKVNNKYTTRDEMNNNGIDIIKFDNNDIQRSRIVKKITDMYNNK
jgi:phosphate starvation-inducible PhoH-like protein